METQCAGTSPVSFGAKNYDAAISMMNEVMNSSCRTMIHDVSVACGNKVIAAQSENIVDGPVMVSFYMTAYETNIDSHSTEGIGVPAQENSENQAAVSRMRTCQIWSGRILKQLRRQHWRSNGWIGF